MRLNVSLILQVTVMNISSSKKLKQPLIVGILGKSIESLTLGLLLRDLGCEVHIYERQKFTSTTLAKGFWADTIVTKYLREHTNITLESFSERVKHIRYLDDKGYIINEENQHQIFGNRCTLQDHLHTLFGHTNYHTSHTINGFMHEKDKVIVSFSNGIKHSFNLLVCTEGPESFIRNVLMPEAKLSYAGYVGWHGLVNTSHLSENTLHKLEHSLVYQLLSNSQIVSHPTLINNNEKGINYTWYQNVVEGDPLNNLFTGVDGKQYKHEIPGNQIQKKHCLELSNIAEKKLSPEMTELINATKKSGLEAIYDLEVKQMAIENIVLLGNSAFHARPHAGMEISKAVTDAWELSAKLLEYNGDLYLALEKWQEKQLLFGQRIVAKSARMGNRSQFENSWQPGDKNLTLGVSAGI